MSRMRVLLVSHAYATPFNRAKAEALAASGEAEVTLLVPGRWAGRVPGAQTGLPYGLARLPVAFPGRGGGYFFRAGLGPLLRELRPDLVHVEEEPWSVAALQFARWKPRCGFRYALFSWENLRKDFRGVRGWMERRTLRAVDLGIGGNETAARELRRKGVGNVCVLPQLGVDPDWFRPGEGPGPAVFTIGYAGRWVEEKGLDILLRAAAALGGAWGLRLLGSGPQEAALRALAKELAVADRVEFLPAVPHAEVAGFLRTLSALVLPSVTRPDWAEQFGHVLIEAMSARVPVVASRSGAIPEVVGDAGLLFPEGDVSALAKALAELRGDLKLAEGLGVRGRERVLRRYTWDRIAGRTLELYRDLLRKETPGAAPRASRPGRPGWEEPAWGRKDRP
ncbi:MAG: glycosyltransferase [Candidatus Tectomicrobia bacterium]|nr:glycosyltransferase [Candidatus Tectomicrobia bacterium]